MADPKKTKQATAFFSVRSRMRRLGFTLVELLVVIAIIGVLVALLLPAVQAAREAARRAQCINNLRQLSLGLINYESANGAFPVAYEYPAGADPANPNTEVSPNWVVKVLPFIEQQAVFDQFDLSRPISNRPGEDPYEENAVNERARNTSLASMLCPSDSFYSAQPLDLGRRGTWARSNYAANAGNGPVWNQATWHAINGPNSAGWQNDRLRGVIGPNVAGNLNAITDGTSNTMLLGEVRAGVTRTDRRGTWAMGQAGSSLLAWYGSADDGDDNGPNVCNPDADDIAVTRVTEADEQLLIAECMPDFLGHDFSNQATTRSLHPGGVVIGLADGSAHFISDDVDINGSFGVGGGVLSVWDKLIASADGEVISESPF